MEMEKLAPVHAMAAIHSCGFQLLQHSPYSPDLAPSDYHLFPQMKKHLGGSRFPSDVAVIDAVKDFLEEQDGTFYHSGIMKLQERWYTCVALKGDYVEN